MRTQKKRNNAVRACTTKTRRPSLSKSEQMSRVRSRDTLPEMLVRRELSQQHVRYRLHRSDMPGTPDIYIGRLHLAIFVNGCFWHGHHCPRATLPKANAEFWHAKITRNIERDERVVRQLEAQGIDVLRLWTCQVAHFSTECQKIAIRYRAIIKP